MAQCPLTMFFLKLKKFCFFDEVQRHEGMMKVLPPQGRQQTFKEYIDRRRGRKEYVSSKGLQQGGMEIKRPDSGLDETLLVYQVWMRTGRRGGKS